MENIPLYTGNEISVWCYERNSKHLVCLCEFQSLRLLNVSSWDIPGVRARGIQKYMLMF